MPILSWLNREITLRVSQQTPFRLLEEDASLGYGDVGAGNMIVQGDNLEAMKSLLPYFSGGVRCIYIDPPYNTKAAFEHYDDNLEHAEWLHMMYPRLELLSAFLSEDGSLWVSVDDTEAHYLKVILDEIMGRDRFILDVSWRKRDGAPNDRKIGLIHEHILVYGKAKQATSKKTVAEESFNLMPRTDKADAQYRVFAEPNGPDPRGPFRKIDTTANGKGGRFVESLFYPVVNPNTGQEVWPREGTCWRHNREEMARLQADGRLYWGVRGTATTPMRKMFLFEAKQGMTTPSIWDDCGLNQHASAEIEKIFAAKAAFETPKPEALLQRIIHIATNPGDLVMDSFLGSGTTAAVAHKMGRRYLGVEIGDHAVTHVVPRLKKVVDGEQGGVSRTENWHGGGGFRFFRLGPRLTGDDGCLNPAVQYQSLASHVWYCETNLPLLETASRPLLGIHSGTAYYLLLGHDNRPSVLSEKALSELPTHLGPKVIYAGASRVGQARLEQMHIVFKQIPYDIRVR